MVLASRIVRGLAVASTALVALVLLCNLALAAQRELKPLSEADLKRIQDALPEKATAKPAKPRKVLIYWKCEGFFHEGGIRWGNKAFELMGEKTGAYSVVVTDDINMFEPEKLQQFDAVIFNNTTGQNFGEEKHRKALLEFVNNGKGIVGTHAATDSWYRWPEGAAMMGALFNGHPWGRCAVKLDDPNHPLSKAFGGKGFWMNDEMYKMKEPYSREKLRVLLSFDMSRMDENADKAGRPDHDNPIAWIQQVGKGRVFYCSFGHQDHIFYTKELLQFYLDGIQYAIGDLPADATPSAKLNPQPKPAPAPEKPEKK
jgi:type 1 glutamine amidotransferase